MDNTRKNLEKKKSVAKRRCKNENSAAGKDKKETTLEPNFHDPPDKSRVSNGAPLMGILPVLWSCERSAKVDTTRLCMSPNGKNNIFTKNTFKKQLDYTGDQANHHEILNKLQKRCIKINLEQVRYSNKQK